MLIYEHTIHPAKHPSYGSHLLNGAQDPVALGFDLCKLWVFEKRRPMYEVACLTTGGLTIGDMPAADPEQGVNLISIGSRFAYGMFSKDMDQGSLRLGGA